jgi:hypothetical protein
MSVLVRIQQSDQVLIGTGIGQTRYINRALMRFDSESVTVMQQARFLHLAWGGARGY